MPRRVEFTIKFAVDLDQVPGWGYQVSDWIDLATRDVLRQTHYNTTAETIEIQEFRPSQSPVTAG